MASLTMEIPLFGQGAYHLSFPTIFFLYLYIYLFLVSLLHCCILSVWH